MILRYKRRKIIKRARHTINNYYKNNKFISNLYKNKAIILNERIGYEKVHLKKVISIVDDSLIKDVDDYNELTKVYLKNIYYIKKIGDRHLLTKRFTNILWKYSVYIPLIKINTES